MNGPAQIRHGPPPPTSYILRIDSNIAYLSHPLTPFLVIKDPSDTGKALPASPPTGDMLMGKGVRPRSILLANATPMDTALQPSEHPNERYLSLFGTRVGRKREGGVVKQSGTCG